jgi:hypothetical protein
MTEDRSDCAIIARLAYMFTAHFASSRSFRLADFVFARRFFIPAYTGLSPIRSECAPRLGDAGGGRAGRRGGGEGEGGKGRNTNVE